MQNITTTQKDAWSQLQMRGATAQVWSNTLGVASFVRGDFGSMGSAPSSGIQSFIREFGVLFGPPDILDTHAFVRVRKDSLGWQHFEYKQTYALNSEGAVNTTTAHVPARRLDVEEAFLGFHVDSRGHLVEVQSSFWRDVFVLPERPIDDATLRNKLVTAFVRGPNVGSLASFRDSNDLGKMFIKGQPRLVIFPFEGGFRLAWRLRAPVSQRFGPGVSGAILQLGVVVIDAVTGEVIYEGTTGSDAETPDAGNGLSNLPFGGPYTNRPLEIVRVDASATYRLRDTTHSRDIVTYDWGGAPANFINLGAMLSNGTVDVSSDTDGDKTWNAVAADSSDAELAAAQQSEVDVHYNIGRVYEWYDALAGPGGREGFDDDNYGANVPGNMPLHGLAHVGWPSAFFYMLPNDGGQEVSYINFSDTVNANGQRAWAASPFVVCHEYQHGITAHSVGSSSPGFDSGANDWKRALNEGLADVFGGLFTGQWYAATDLSPEGLILRNLAFPRDTETTSSNVGLDHYDDRGAGDGPPYPRGQILAHCAYLASQGGVHQRTGRTPELIPVHGLGTEESEGLDVPRAARIWYRMMATRFAMVGPYDDEIAFRNIRTECEASAIDLFGEGSKEHRAIVQAFYATGLHPAGEVYGPDVTALRWGYSWRFSRPYLGIPSPDWASPDLFINNGGTSDWNAIINAEGSETEFENAVYCRVRNIGDQTANDIVVQLDYAKHGTAPVVWTPMRDAAGVIQTLNIESLAAGASNFEMEDQDSPPESARVLWSVPPLMPEEEVDHYCIRASISASSDVNPHNGIIQSNVAYTVMTGMMVRSHAFTIGNPTDTPLQPDLRLSATLPEGWRTRIREDLHAEVIAPHSERTVHVEIMRPEGSNPDDATVCLPPFDGEVRGDILGTLGGRVSGTLSNVKGTSAAMTGTMALRLEGGGMITGRFKGVLECPASCLAGQVIGSYQCVTGRVPVCLQLKACLRPYRVVNIQQRIGDRVLGGITLQLQMPLPERCEWPHAPTNTRYRPTLCQYHAKHTEASCGEDGIVRTGKVTRICYNCFGDFEGFVLESCETRFTCRSTEPAIEALVKEAFKLRWLLQAELSNGRGIVRDLAIVHK